MPLPLLVAPLALIGATGASIAIPHFFPTESEKATIELNKKLTGVTLPKNDNVKPDDKKKFSFDLKDTKTQMIVFALIAIVVLMLVVSR